MNSLHPTTYLICCTLLVGLCAGCTKPPTPRPATTGNEAPNSTTISNTAISNTTTSNTTAAASTDSEPAAETSEPTSASSEPATAVAEPAFAPAPEGKVLRHAVFFSFKEEAGEADIQGVVDAFRELPSKVEQIIDFEWGVNNSPEGLNDGFTHCFLLTFKDEAGRAAYLPHPAHKAFGNVLRPHNDKVFVIDYWGNAGEPLKKELKHAVFFRFKKDTAAEDIKQVEDAFAALPSKIDTIKRFEWGINNSPERHSAGFTHCFMVTFDSEEGRTAYLPHADHLAFVEILKPILDAPRVLDYWAEK